MVTLEKLVESGVHLGHDTSNWNPKMDHYIYEKNDSIYILNLSKTTRRLQQACNFLVRAGYQNKTILFIGTTEAASKLVKTHARKAQAHYVNYRWIGGMLTNHSTILKSINKFKLSAKSTHKRSKKDQASFLKKRRNVVRFFGGIEKMKNYPDIVIFIGQPGRSNPLKECQTLGIKTIALVDSNSNTKFVDLPIPANDDSISSLELILNVLSSSISSGKKMKVRLGC